MLRSLCQGVQWGMGSEAIQARCTYQSFMMPGGGKNYAAKGGRFSELQMRCLSMGNRWKELVSKQNKRYGKWEKRWGGRAPPSKSTERWIWRQMWDMPFSPITELLISLLTPREFSSLSALETSAVPGCCTLRVSLGRAGRWILFM